MPTLNIEGRKVKVDDSFLKLSPADQQSTVEEIASQLGIKTASQDAPVSGLKDQFSAGFESNVELPGLTVETLGKTAQDKNVEATGKWIRGLTEQPKNFVSASDRFINPKPGDSYVDPIMGFGWGNAPGAAAEVGGQVAGDMMARGGVSVASGAAGALGGFAAGGPVGAGAGFTGGAVGGALAGPAVLEFMRVAGPVAIARAQNADPPREVPTWEDWQYAAGTAGLAGALNAIGIKGIGKLNAGVGAVGKKTATEVVKEGAKETGKKALTEGVTEAGQSVVQQAGETAFTDKGLQIDLKQAVGEGILGTGAGGVIDAGRNIRPVVSAVNDIRSVDSDIKNDPYARDAAEFTQRLNGIYANPARKGAELTTKEVGRVVNDLVGEAEKAIKGQNLSPQDKKDLIRGLKNADGLDQARLDEIAGRSENPSEIKALANKIQMIRGMTAPQQARKGVRGALASAARYGGGMAGAAAGQVLGTGAIEGAAIGTGVGRIIAQKLSNSQTTGNRINSLIGKKQARRAAMLLDRYGPSEATTALNTLSEKAAANKAQAEADAQAKADFEETMSRIRFQNTLREKSRRAMEQATTKEEKAKATAEKQKLDLATREERLKGLAFRSQINQARAQKLVQDLEAKKSMNALTIEMAQTRKELQQKMAEAKADKLNRDADFAVKNLSGKLEMLAIDIQRRQEALKKAEIATKRAEKMANKSPVSRARAAAVGKKYASMTADEMALAGIKNPVARRETMQMMDEERAKIEQGISETTDPEFRALLRGLFRQLENIKNNNAERKKAYEDYLDAAASLDPKYRNRMEDLFDRFATHKFKFERDGQQTAPQDSEQDPPF